MYRDTHNLFHLPFHQDSEKYPLKYYCNPRIPDLSTVPRADVPSVAQFWKYVGHRPSLTAFHVHFHRRPDNR